MLEQMLSWYALDLHTALKRAFAAACSALAARSR